LDKKTVKKILNKINISGGFSFVPLSGGMNNKVFRISTQESDFLLKSYFCHPHDQRDRLGAEYAFLKFAKEFNIDCVPKTIVKNRRKQIALYQFIYGCGLTLGDVNAKNVELAVKFFFELNSYKDYESARNLSDASEACFTFSDLFSRVKRRMNQLEMISDSIAKKFISEKIRPAWQEALKFANGRLQTRMIDPNTVISKKMLSPSDFGFHNAILSNNNKLYFIDFEYAGWDGPSQIICDFFCQPKIPVPLKYYPIWLAKFQDQKDREIIDFSVRTLLPIYRIKWCCILLNHFFIVGKERRKFSTQIFDIDLEMKIQFKKAENVLHRLFEFPS